MNHEELIKKIQKLLALATSPNENEAKLAATKAQELLTLHNLNMQQVEGAVFDYEELEVGERRKRAPMEHRFVAAILDRFFFVEVITTRNRKTGVSFSLVGERPTRESHPTHIRFWLQNSASCLTSGNAPTALAKAVVSLTTPVCMWV